MGYLQGQMATQFMGGGHVQGCYRRREGLAQAMPDKANRSNNAQKALLVVTFVLRLMGRR